MSEASTKHRDSSDVGQGATTLHLRSGTPVKSRPLSALCKQSSNKISAVSLHRFLLTSTRGGLDPYLELFLSAVDTHHWPSLPDDTRTPTYTTLPL